MTYYGVFHGSALYPVLYRVNTYLLRWIMKKYKDLRTWKKALRANRRALCPHIIVPPFHSTPGGAHRERNDPQ